MKLAREAGFNPVNFMGGNLELFERFAALVAEAEREECAKVCLEEAPSLDGQLCADAIRARGEQ
jgi:hypothetical protein